MDNHPGSSGGSVARQGPARALPQAPAAASLSAGYQRKLSCHSPKGWPTMVTAMPPASQ